MGTSYKVLKSSCQSINRFFFFIRAKCIQSEYFMYRHTTAVSGSDIDAAAMEFERRFHISVDASEDREQQVD